MVSLGSGLGTLPCVSLARLCKDMVEFAIEDTEKEEREEDHDKKVTDKNVVTTILQVLPQLCGTKVHLAITLISHFAEADLSIVQGVAGLQLQESWDVPERGEENHREGGKSRGESGPWEMENFF